MKKLMFAILLSTSFNATANRIILEDMSCGKYFETDSDLKVSYKNWFYGFLSGANLSTNVDFLGGIDSQGVVAALEKYCRENPLDYFSQAAVSVRNQLQKRAKK